MNDQEIERKAATQSDEIKRLTETVQRLRKDKLQLLADLKKQEKTND